MRYLLVGNPTAQSGKGEQRIQHVLDAMNRRGLEVAFEATLPGGKTVPMVTRAADSQQYDVVLYLGGDGTFAEVAKGIVAAKHPVVMGMMPAGTANDQGKSFGIRATPDALEENLDILVAGHQIQMDVGTLARVGADGAVRSRELWFDNIGFGFAPSILARRNRDRQMVGQIPVLRELYRDQAVYAGAVLGETLRSYVDPVKFDAHISVDGAPEVVIAGLMDIVINNTPMYGGEWIPVRTAVADDGLLDLSTLLGRRDMVTKLVLDHKLTNIWDESLEAMGVDLARNFRGASFEITLLQPHGGDIPSQIDGEEWEAGTAFQVGVLPGILPVIVRGNFVPPWRSPESQE